MWCLSKNKHNNSFRKICFGCDFMPGFYSVIILFSFEFTNNVLIGKTIELRVKKFWNLEDFFRLGKATWIKDFLAMRQHNKTRWNLISPLCKFANVHVASQNINSNFSIRCSARLCKAVAEKRNWIASAFNIWFSWKIQEILLEERKSIAIFLPWNFIHLWWFQFLKFFQQQRPGKSGMIFSIVFLIKFHEILLWHCF